MSLETQSCHIKFDTYLCFRPHYSTAAFVAVSTLKFGLFTAENPNLETPNTKHTLTCFSPVIGQPAHITRALKLLRAQTNPAARIRGDLFQHTLEQKIMEWGHGVPVQIGMRLMAH